MRARFLVCFLLLFPLLTGMVNGFQPWQSSQVGGQVGAPPLPAPEAVIQAAVQAYLTNRQNAPGNPVVILTAQEVVWPDGCLGVRKPGQMCTQAIVPGWFFWVDLNGAKYSVHTNQTGSNIYILNGLETVVPGLPVQPPPVGSPASGIRVYIPMLIH